MSRGVKGEDRNEWERRGGRVRIDAKGRPVYVIRRQIGGRRFEVSTRRHSLSAALAELERFERDPEGYHPGGDPGAAALYLDNELAQRFLAWSAGERGNSTGWLAKQRTFLADWMERLRGVNLRRLSLRDHVVPALEKATSHRHRLAVLKALYSWLRKHEHILTSAEDATIDMPLPQTTPAQWKRSKVIPRDHIDLVLEHLSAPWRDALTVQLGTAWHTTEVVRFAAGGSVERLPRTVAQEGVGGVLALPLHKSGEPLRTRVSVEVVEAAKRLLAHGPLSREWYDRSVRSACGAAEIPVWTPGRIRHSVATMAVEDGTPPPVVAAYLNHKSARTTQKFYAVHASAMKVPTLR
jgi:integrase